MLNQLPHGLREQVALIAPRLLRHEPAALGYFEVIANSINIMQDHITRTRLAGEPPHVMLLPRLHYISLMEFNRAKDAIAEGRLCVEQALTMIRRFVS
jgi:NTE family protein